MFHNPVIPGFHPDPSVCRVDDDYYCTTSTFEYFPGLPIFHSRDLVRWRLIGHALHRLEQLTEFGFHDVPCSGGVFAPTLRFHVQRQEFFLVSTLVSSLGPPRYETCHFVLSARNPAGPWSHPVLIRDAPGIDPSLLFDFSSEGGDGKTWFCANRYPEDGEKFPGHREVWIQQFDLDSMSLVGERLGIWSGSSRTAVACEAPHLYRVGRWVYLLTAEGGTALNHSVCIARSESVEGPYIGHPGNPLLTHRHFGTRYPITGTGHGDLIQTPHGEWWMLLLAMRPYEGYFYNLGRETFLTEVEWGDDDWPSIVGGVVADKHRAPALTASRWPALPACDQFSEQKLDLRFNFVRVPPNPEDFDFWSLSERPGHLRLKLRPERMTDATGCPSFVGRRQCHKSFSSRTLLKFAAGTGTRECAGMVIRQSCNFHLAMLVTRGVTDIEVVEVLMTQQHDRHNNGPVVEKTLGSWRIPRTNYNSSVVLCIEAHGQSFTFTARTPSSEWVIVASDVDGRILSSPVAGGFVGTYIGMYASSNGKQSSNRADFEYFEYAPTVG